MERTMTLTVKKVTPVEKSVVLPDHSIYDNLMRITPSFPVSIMAYLIELENPTEPGITYRLERTRLLQRYVEGEQLEVTLHTTWLGKLFASEKMEKESGGTVEYLPVKNIQRKQAQIQL